MTVSGSRFANNWEDGFICCPGFVQTTIFSTCRSNDGKRAGRPRKYGESWYYIVTCLRNREQAREYTVNLYGRIRTVLAYDRIVMLKTLKCPVKVVWMYRRTQWVALFSTDLTLSVAEIIEYYGARWKIEAGFKELKRDIGSAETQNRNPVAVKNHLNFCMMAMVCPHHARNYPAICLVQNLQSAASERSKPCLALPISARNSTTPSWPPRRFPGTGSGQGCGK